MVSLASHLIFSFLQDQKIDLVQTKCGIRPKVLLKKL